MKADEKEKTRCSARPLADTDVERCAGCWLPDGSVRLGAIVVAS